jgi:heterodisulfide reductase subunit A
MKTHEPLFQETLVNAGLNKYLFEKPTSGTRFVGSQDEPRGATERPWIWCAWRWPGSLMTPSKADVDINQRALVVGGHLGHGVCRISQQGYK